MVQTKRRDFLKAGAAGITTIAMSGAGSVVGAKTTAVWKQINPAIDNLRVVFAHDTVMTSGGDTGRQRIHDNLDKMARTLAQKSTAAEAWLTIFQKSSTKRWSDLSVKIKASCLEPAFVPRAEIVEKLCLVLNTINSGDSSDPGVPFGNITVFDRNGDAWVYGGKIPSGVNTSGDLGTPDIFINLAVNKGHVQNDKQFTLTSKNYYGIFGAGSGPEGCGDMSYMLGLVKRNELMGGTPIRCQLNIVDALWSMIGGPTAYQGYTTTTTSRIAMGTLGPVVDFLVAKEIRNGVMGQGHDMGIINRFMDDFGYTAEKAGLVSVNGLNTTAQAATPAILPTELSFTDTVQVTLSCSTPGATIRYTTNGSTPGTGSTAYASTPITISATATVKAVAFASGMDASNVATATFTKVTLRDPENPATTSAGLRYNYSEATVSSIDEIAALSVKATGTATTITNSVRQRDDDYALSFEGFITIPSNGSYTFNVVADDVAAIYIGDTKIAQCHWSDGDTGQSGSIGLKAGKHALKVLYFQGGGGAGLTASISSASMTKQAIPASMLTRIPGATVGRSVHPGSASNGLRVGAAGSNALSIEIDAQGTHVCTVSRADGRVVASRAGTGKATYKVTRGIAPGSYSVNVEHRGGRMVQRVVVLAR